MVYSCIFFLRGMFPSGILLLTEFVAGIIPPILIALYVEEKRAKNREAWKYEAKFSPQAVEEYQASLEKAKKKKRLHG